MLKDVIIIDNCELVPFQIGKLLNKQRFIKKHDVGLLGVLNLFLLRILAPYEINVHLVVSVTPDRHEGQNKMIYDFIETVIYVTFKMNVAYQIEFFLILLQ